MRQLLLCSLVSFVALAQRPLPNGSGSGSGGGTGTVTHTGALTATHIMKGNGTADSAVTGCTIDSNDNAVCPGGFESGSGSGKTGKIQFFGATSGSQVWTVPDVAGTPIGYLLPTTNGSSGQALTDNGSATCPTWATSVNNPVTCRQLNWATPSGSGGGTTSQGAFASLPGTCTTGDVYYFTDSLYTHARCSATNTWSHFFDGKLAYPPSTTTWTNVNFTNVTTSDTYGYRTMTVPTSATTAQSYQTAVISSSGNYTKTFAFRIDPTTLVSTTRNLGVYLTDGTKVMFFQLVIVAGAMDLVVDTCTNQAGTSGCADLVGPAVLSWTGGNFYVQVTDDTSTLSLKYGSEGNTWKTIYSAGRTGFFSTGATGIGYGSGVNGTLPINVILASYH